MPIELYRWLNTAQDRNFRNRTNDNWEKLERTHNSIEEDSKQAIADSSIAKERATRADKLSSSVQAQLETIVVSGDSGPEAAQARVDSEGVVHDTLKKRADSDFEKTNDTIKIVKEVLQDQLDSNKVQIEVLSRNKVYVENEIGNSATEKINKAIAKAPDGSEIIIDREYSVSGIDIKDKSNLKTTGGGTLNLIGDSSYGFKLTGNIRDIEIEKMTIKGSNDFLALQHGITSSSGQNIIGVSIHDLVIENVAVGISLNADLSGVYDNARVFKNRLKNMKGTLPGEGYGIHLANATNTIVEENEIDGAQRHSIYQAKGGKGNRIKKNTIKNHRLGSADGTYRPALYIARSRNVIVEDNLLIDCYDGCIMISGDSTTGYITTDIDVLKNTIINPKNVVSPIICGEQIIPSALTQRVNFSMNNVIYNTYPGGAVFKFLNGIDIKILLNNITVLGVDGKSVFGVELSDNFISDSSHANNIKIHQNTFNFQGDLASSRAHHVGARYTGGSMYVDIRNSSYVGGVYTDIEFGAAISNPNLTYARKVISDARPNTSGASLSVLEMEVNELKKRLRELGLMKTL
ncbi:hypothetical protein bcgnr5371_57490 [Bacillus cereus]